MWSEKACAKLRPHSVLLLWRLVGLFLEGKGKKRKEEKKEESNVSKNPSILRSHLHVRPWNEKGPMKQDQRYRLEIELSQGKAAIERKSRASDERLSSAPFFASKMPHELMPAEGTG